MTRYVFVINSSDDREAMGVHIMMVSATTDYSVRIMVALTKCDGVVSSTMISKQARVPQKYLIKIANLLKNAGLIVSHEGGCSLSRLADEITVWGMLRGINGDRHIIDRSDGKPEDVNQVD